MKKHALPKKGGMKLRKAGIWLVDKYRNFRKRCGKPLISSERVRLCRKLYPSEKPEEFLRNQDGRRIGKAGMIFCAGSILCMVILWVKEGAETVTVLERPEYGEMEAIYQLEVEREGGERLPMEVAVSERAVTQEEAGQWFEEAYEEICKDMLGKNKSMGHVDTDLTLPEKAGNGLVKAEWISQSQELFNDWGELQKQPGELRQEGETGYYELLLSCGGYSCQYEIELTVYPPEQTEEEILLDALETELLKEQEKERDERKIPLPETYGNEKLTWFLDGEGNIGNWILGIPVALGLLFIVRERQQEKGKLKAREREMLMDYPELVSKFTVLLQAGLTARNVWERMVKEYEERKMAGKKSRYAYEEMSITWKQMKNGMYESRAYGEFGRRCGLHTYMKLGALLEQNLRQGTTKLAVRLKEEAELAFEERKNLARRLGEEAETRLMLPMFMMLFMVLTVIMVPAFLSF